MNPRLFAPGLIFLILTLFFPLVAVADGSSPKQNYSITPSDADAKLIFTLTDNKTHSWTDLFTSSTTRAAVSQWQAISDTPVGHEDIERQTHLLMLLYWQSYFSSFSTHAPDTAKAPYSTIDADELKMLHSVVAELPTEVLKNAFNDDGHWYRVALQKILAGEGDNQQTQEDAETLKKIVKGTGQTRDALTEWMMSLQAKATAISKSNPKRAKLLRSQAKMIEPLIGAVSLTKNEDDFSFKISAALRKRLPASFFSGHGDKTVKLPIDKALVIVELLSTFTQNLAVSKDRSNQVTELLNYARDNQISVDPNFDAQARSLDQMSGDTNQILVATFLSTTVDWVTQTAITTTPKVLAILSQRLSSALEKAAPKYSGYLSNFSFQVVDRFGLFFAATAGADLLFNTSGIYDGIKAAEFSERCSEQFDQISDGARKHLNGPNPTQGSLMSWANADYYHEVSVAAYHTNYASLLSGGRGATFLANLITDGSIDDVINSHTTQGNHIGKDAEAWAHPYGLERLLKLYRDADPLQVTGSSPPPTVQLPFISHGYGFADHSDLTTNGSAAFRSSQLVANRISAVLTDGSQQAGSLFSRAAVDITHFNTQFTFKFSGDSTSFADGITFTVQSNGPTSLGGGGGSLGYGDEQGAVNLPDGIKHSVTIKFDTYDDLGEGNNSTGLFSNGSYPGLPSTDLTPMGIDLHSGDIFRVSIRYDGTILRVVIIDAKTHHSSLQSYKINIPSTIGANKAYVGFTGGTGEQYAIQEIYSWLFSSSATSQSAESLDVLKDEAQMKYVIKDFPEAEKLYRQLITKMPNEAPYQYRLAECLEGEDRLAEATTAYRQAIATIDHDPSASDNNTKIFMESTYYEHLGNLLAKEDLYSDAVEALRRSLKFTPGNVRVQNAINELLANEHKTM